MSIILISQPFDSSKVAIFLPMNPDPPVMRAFMEGKYQGSKKIS
jgi:hypothetical protein